MSLYDAALRLEIKEAEAKVLAGEKPRNPFERVIFGEARDQLAKRLRRA